MLPQLPAAMHCWQICSPQLKLCHCSPVRDSSFGQYWSAQIGLSYCHPAPYRPFRLSPLWAHGRVSISRRFLQWQIHTIVINVLANVSLADHNAINYGVALIMPNAITDFSFACQIGQGQDGTCPANWPKLPHTYSNGRGGWGWYSYRQLHTIRNRCPVPDSWPY